MINYNVVFYMYLSCCGLLVFFLLLERLLERLDEEHWAKDNLQQITGVHVIFAPFVPCLFWSLWMMRRAKSVKVKVP